MAKLGWMTRFYAGLLGGDRDRLAQAGADDAARFRLLAVAVSALGLWVALNVAHTLVIATGAGFGHPTVLAWAGLIAALYLCVDLALLQGRIWANGQRLARQRGFDPVPLGRAGRALAWLGALPFAGLRLGLTVAFALFAATSFGLWYWQNDIAARLATDHAAANAALRQQVEARLDAELAALSAEADAMSARAEAARHATAVAAKRAEAERDIHASRLRDLLLRDAALADQIECVTRNRDAEADGFAGCDGVVRRAGPGDNWAAAEAELASLKRQQTALAGQIAATRAAMAPQPTAKAPPDPDAAGRALLLDQRSAMIAARPATVQAQMQADAAYMAPADGLMIRARTLARMAADEPAVAAMLVITKALFILLDLSVVAIAFGNGPASLYALRQVLSLETSAAADIAEARLTIADTQTRAAEAEAQAIRARIKVLAARREYWAEMRRMQITEAALSGMAAELGDANDRPLH